MNNLTNKSKKKRDKHEILFHKLLFTGLIVVVYLIGRTLPLFGMDLMVDTSSNIDIQELLLRTVSGDRNQNSMFTLGVFPYMIASLVIQIVMATMSADTRSRISQVKINKITLRIMFVVSIIQAFYKMGDLYFRYVGWNLVFAKVVVLFQMVAGAFIILWLSDRNSRYGVGGQTTLIYINILDGLTVALQGNPILKIIIPIIISVLIVIVVIVMENAEKRIPVQRIAIHSIYEDKNYLAIKLNPIGVMPVMFSSAMFMLLQIIVAFLAFIAPDSGVISWLHNSMVLDNPFGIVMYILVLYFLTIGMAVVFLSPKDLTENLLKSGDSIVNLHAGKDTLRYLREQIFIISIISSTVMGICILIPIVLEYYGVISSSLAILPSSFMMLAGIFYNLAQEVIAIRNFDAYKPFI